MNISRNFLLIGGIYLVIGIAMGMHMGAAGDHSMSVAHAHINLIGFTLSVLFALTYRAFADLGASRLAVWNFWLHVIGGTVVLVMLTLMLAGVIGEAAMVPAAPLAELSILIGVLLFLFNAWKNAR